MPARSARGEQAAHSQKGGRYVVPAKKLPDEKKPPTLMLNRGKDGETAMAR